MCGSGTLAIEAALIATDTRPGLFRDNYGFMHIVGYDESVYLAERGKLETNPREEHAIRSYFTHIENRDFAALAAACTDDVVYRMPSGGEVIAGRAAFRAGRIPRKRFASASSPVDGLIG